MSDSDPGICHNNKVRKPRGQTDCRDQGCLGLSHLVVLPTGRWGGVKPPTLDQHGASVILVLLHPTIGAQEGTGSSAQERLAGPQERFAHFPLAGRALLEGGEGGEAGLEDDVRDGGGRGAGAGAGEGDGVRAQGEPGGQWGRGGSLGVLTTSALTGEGLAVLQHLTII